jgi:hypothetical protein
MIMKGGDKVLAKNIMTDVSKKLYAHRSLRCAVLVDITYTNHLTCPPMTPIQTLEHVKRKQVEKYHKAPQGKREDIECNPYTIFHQALDNCKPVIGLASIQKGGKFYQVSAIHCFLTKCAFFILYSKMGSGT